VNPSGRDTLVVAVGLLLVAAVFLVYGNALGNGFVIDDRAFVEQNPIIRDLANVPRMFTSGFWESTSASVRALYRPIVSVSYALNYAVGGLDPFGYHLVNVFLHAANTLLLFVLVYLLSRRTLFSAAVAAVFGLHPIGTDSVAWVAQRSELMAAFFALGALALYTLAFPPVGRRDSGARRTVWLRVGSVVAFLLALLSKEGALALPGVLIIYDLAFRSSPGRWKRLAPYLGLTAVYVGAIQIAFGGPGAYQIEFVFNPLIQEPAGVRVLTGVKLLGLGLSLLMWPVRLVADYSFDSLTLVNSPWGPGVLAAGIGTLLLVGLLLLSWRRHRMLFFGLGVLCCYLGLLFVNALNPMASMFAERFLYMPSVGFALTCVGLADLVLRLVPRQREILGPLLLALVVLAFSVRVRSRNFEWHDNYTLLVSAADANPRSAWVQASLAGEHFERGDFQSARLHSLNATEIYPEYSRAYLNLGEAALAEGAYAEAVGHLSTAVRLSPRSSTAHSSLGLAYKELGDLAAAEEHYNRALEINPNSPLSLNNLANLAILQGARPRALALWQRALAIDPLNPAVLFNLALEHERMGQIDQARVYYRRFLSVAPDRMERQRSLARSKLGDS
jgi:tetratricopeptide (TPR) repeat protein